MDALFKALCEVRDQEADGLLAEGEFRNLVIDAIAKHTPTDNAAQTLVAWMVAE